MKIKNITQPVGDFFDDIFSHTKHTIKKSRYLTAAFIGAVLIGIGVGAYYLYILYRNHQYKKVEQILAYNIDSYNSFVATPSTESADHIIKSLEQAYGETKGSQYAPYFLIYQSNVYLEQQNLPKAIEYIKQAISELKDASLKNLFSVKYALMLSDTQNVEDIEQATTLLATLAQDATNIYNDMARYYLGKIYFLQGKTAQAQEEWQKLVDAHKMEKVSPSLWAVKAQEYLATIV